MSVEELLNEIRNRGVMMHADGDTLVLRPAEAVSDLIPALKASKPEILRRLCRTPDRQGTEDDRELTDYLVSNILEGGAYARLLPQVRRYLGRSLPASMVTEIESAFAEHRAGHLH